MQDGEAVPAEQQAWAEFWELVGEAAYQLWRDGQMPGDFQESA